MGAQGLDDPFALGVGGQDVERSRDEIRKHGE